MEGYIVGGEVTTILKYPHAVFLHMDCKPKVVPHVTWICGASVINQMLLLTAAHCIFECHKNVKITAFAGDTNRTIGTQRTARSIVTHENYVLERFFDDIGIIKLKNQLKLGANVMRVALMKNPPYEEEAEIAGWGDTFGDTVHLRRFVGSMMLKKSIQWVWPLKDCKRFFQNHMEPRTICASSENSNSYSSRGDSGSALLVRGYIQIGAMSFRVPKRAPHVGIYTDVGAFYHWIELKANELQCSL